MEAYKKLSQIKSALREFLKTCQFYDAVDKLDLISIDDMVMIAKTQIKPYANALDERCEYFLQMLSDKPEMVAKIRALNAEQKSYVRLLVDATLDLIE